MDFLYKPSYTPISSIFEYKNAESLASAYILNELFGTEHTFKGWIRFVRKQSNLTFLQIYDGSYASALQLIFDEKNQDVLDKVKDQLHVGATVVVKGIVKKSPATGQDLEVHIKTLEVVGPIQDPMTYLPCVKKIPLEVLRKVQHLRPKFKSYGAIYRIRSLLLQTVHEFFKLRNFLLLDPNIITTSDCEGAGEVFTITNLLKDGDVAKIPVVDKSTKIDFGQDFFLKQAYLTVSSQLQLEALCAGMGPVYTTNPSFRAEPSKTKRHLCCFTHIEWEMPFIDLKDLMDFSEDFVTYCFKSVLEKAKPELQELDAFVAKGLIDRLQSFVKERFARITYDEAIDILYKHEKEVLEKFKDDGLLSLPKWGDDLGSYCERFISEVIYKKPVFVYNYPRDLKSFYMKQNAPYTVTLADGSTETRHVVQNNDLLIPYLGELIGSSIRTDNYDDLVMEMKRRKMDVGSLQWYVDLRKDGTFPHGGAGLGFDRLVSVCTGTTNIHIRDAVPFPVSYQDVSY